MQDCFFNDTATTESYTLSLHDALPIYEHIVGELGELLLGRAVGRRGTSEITIFKSLGLAVEDVAAAAFIYERATAEGRRSEEHTSELQSRQYLVCRLLLEKKFN